MPTLYFPVRAHGALRVASADPAGPLADAPKAKSTGNTPSYQLLTGVQAEAFSQLILKRSMVKDHSMTSYLSALAAVSMQGVAADMASSKLV